MRDRLVNFLAGLVMRFYNRFMDPGDHRRPPEEYDNELANFYSQQGEHLDRD